MKKALLLAAFIVACGPKEEPAVDTAATAAPPGLTAADLTGTFTGTSWIEGTDSVASRFTLISTDGVNGKFIEEGQKDTVTFTSVIDGDSAVATSAPYTDQMLPNKPQVTFRSVARKQGDKIAGTAALMLVSKPDSVVGRVRWEATKSP
ncbi:MAG TPA: hypothetical protein VJ717_19025 [Gemmatimonadaceae bacterium]|nr:hypothetical protein [Gemmatimonadaceae bacterium]